MTYTQKHMDLLSASELDERYRPFLNAKGNDWTGQVVEEEGFQIVKQMLDDLPRKVRVLVLYGSLRER